MSQQPNYDRLTLMNINATIRVRYVGAPEGDYRWSIESEYNGEQWGNSGFANDADRAKQKAERAGKDYYDSIIASQQPEQTFEVDLSTLSSTATTTP